MLYFYRCMHPIRTVHITRYITPLREGGSLPAITEADDGFMYVIKFRGAGQGIKALIAEFICGALARVLGLRLPEIVFAELDEAFGRTEPDEEIQDLLKASTGLNLGLHYLNGATGFDNVVHVVDGHQASLIVWLDCFILNVDRTCRNTNLLMWKNELWLIDHGAALFFHHSWQDWEAKAAKPFTYIKDHCLLGMADDLTGANAFAQNTLNYEVLKQITDNIPVEWLETADTPFDTTEEQRNAYLKFLSGRLSHADIFVNAAIDEREKII